MKLSNSIKKTESAKRKQGGFVMTSELLLLSSVMVVSLAVGMVNVRDAMVAELDDTAEAIGSLDQSYAFDGILNSQGTAEVAGSAFGDDIDVTAGDSITGFTYIAPSATERNTAVVATAETAGTGGNVGNQ